MTITTTISRIRSFAQTQGWTRNRLAVEAGVAESTIRNIFDEDWNPRAKTLLQLERVIPDDFHAQAEAAE